MEIEELERKNDVVNNYKNEKDSNTSQQKKKTADGKLLGDNVVILGEKKNKNVIKIYKRSKNQVIKPSRGYKMENQ